MKECIISIDQGTSSCRAIAFDLKGKCIGVCQKEFTQIFPHQGWVEHNPLEIWEVQMEVLYGLIEENNIESTQIVGIGITNQRETTVVWDKKTGEPVYNAIVWQDKRTVDYCIDLEKRGFKDYIRQNTGLVLDAYFSGTKVQWILDHVQGAREKAESGELLFGTIDTWLIWKMTEGKSHVTDFSNASRTMIFNIMDLQWDKKLLEAMHIPLSMMPSVYPSSHLFGHCLIEDHPIPICGVAGDQQAALFGQQCFNKGEAKNTYGTGCFMLMNTGEVPIRSQRGLLTTVAWGIEGKVTYALEGSVFIAGAAVQWLRDGLGFFKESQETAQMALEAKEAESLVVVPTFSGLGSPYWDMHIKGAIFGITRDTGKNEITKATLNAIAFQSKDVLESMEADSGIALTKLLVDGGACSNAYLMQFQSDILNVEVHRPANIESTAFGVYLLAALHLNHWEISQKQQSIERVFSPQMSEEQRQNTVSKWDEAIRKLRN